MTAYAEGKKNLPCGILEISLKSVNHRALDIEFQSNIINALQEENLRQYCKKNLFRGKIRVVVRFTTDSDSKKLNLNHSVLNNYLNLEQELLNAHPHFKGFSVFEILQMAGVLEEPNFNENEMCIETLFKEVFEKFLSARKEEGNALTLFLKEKTKTLEKELKELNQNLAQINAFYREKSLQKLKEWQATLPLERFQQEWSAHLLKTDIAEELSRLNAHAQSLWKTFESPSPHGKRLDFLMQELMREANTLSSKAIGMEISESALTLKILIEQMREQIQNIE